MRAKTLLVQDSRILVVEDQANVAYDVRSRLRDCGFPRTVWASSSDEALRLLAIEPFALVLMDVELPDQADGIDAARSIQDQHGIPVIFLTAYDRDDYIQRAAQVDNFGYLLKSASDAQLASTVKVALHKASMLRRLRKNTQQRSEGCAFICYAREDNDSVDRRSRWLDRLLQQMIPLGIRDKLVFWCDRDITMGIPWEPQIEAALHQATVAVVLASPGLLASQFVREREMPVLLARAKSKLLSVVPVLVRPCQFEAAFKYPDCQKGPFETALSAFTVYPKDGRALTALIEHEQDDVLRQVAKGVVKLIKGPP